MPLHIDTTDAHPRSLVRLRGDLDVGAAPRVRAVLAAAVAGAAVVVVDLAEVDVVDAPGLGALLGAHRRARELGRVVVLAGAGEGVRRALVVTGISRVVATAPSVEAALVDTGPDPAEAVAVSTT